MVSIVWTEISIEDLKIIFDFISEDSFHYASITVNKIYNKAQELSHNPFIGRIVPEVRSNTIREVIEGNFRIIYQIENNTQVNILRVYHSARLFRTEELG